MLDVKRLRVLREVAARGSFSAAAEALSYTQSAVSQQIAALEREAGTTLVDRLPRGIRLTEAGRALVGHAEAILARLADAEAELDAIAGLEGGRLRLGSFVTAGASLVPPAVAAFSQRHPAIQLSLAEGEPEDLLAGVRSGELDLALTFEYVGVPGFLKTGMFDGITFTHLLDDPMLVLLPRDHPLAARSQVSLSALSEDAWIHGSPNSICGMVVVQACHAEGFEPLIAFESDDYGIVQGLVAAGVGVSLIPELAMRSLREDVVVRPLADVRPKRRVGVAATTGGYRSPAVLAMLDILVETVADYAAERVPLEAV